MQLHFLVMYMENFSPLTRDACASVVAAVPPLKDARMTTPCTASVYLKGTENQVQVAVHLLGNKGKSHSYIVVGTGRKN